MNNKGLWAVLGVAAIVVLWAVSAYNRMVGLREQVPETFAQVENVLQRRYDLIPNLVATVKGYAKHEGDLLTEVTRLRSQWGAAKSPEEKIKASGQLESALGRLMVVIENYPVLKANENFLRLQDELAGTENRIAVERKRYNEVIRAYNIAVKRFPSNLVARLTGYAPSDAYFEAASQAKQAPKVEF